MEMMGKYAKENAQGVNINFVTMIFHNKSSWSVSISSLSSFIHLIED